LGGSTERSVATSSSRAARSDDAPARSGCCSHGRTPKTGLSRTSTTRVWTTTRLPTNSRAASPQCAAAGPSLVLSDGSASMPGRRTPSPRVSQSVIPPDSTVISRPKRGHGPSLLSATRRGQAAGLRARAEPAGR